MSEMINNREQRQIVLKQLIQELHGGASVEEVQERFAEIIEGVSATEISEMEQKLKIQTKKMNHDYKKACPYRKCSGFAMSMLLFLRDPLKKFMAPRKRQKYRVIHSIPSFRKIAHWNDGLVSDCNRQ